jgi:glycosyltransferase involved in cell wall biosynthesis
VSAVAERVARRGHRVSVFTTTANLDCDLDVPADVPIDVDGVTVRYFKRHEPLKRFLPFIPYLAKSAGYLYAPGLRRALREAAPTADIVHTHFPCVYPTFAAARAARLADVPLLYHQRGAFDPARLGFRPWKKRLYIGLIEKGIMQQAAALIALTDFERITYRSLRVTTPSYVIPNGVDIREYRTSSTQPLHEIYGFPQHAPVVLFLGRLHPQKGAHLLLEAFARLHGKVPDATLIVAGPDEWGLAGRLHEMATGTERSRGIFTGPVDGDLKRDLLARADLFCLPSEGEGFSVAVLEALASGTPVLLSPACNFPEVEEAGVGRVVSRDPEAIAAAMAHMLSDRDHLRSMGAAARRFVATCYDWECIVDRLLDLYARVLAQRAAAASAFRSDRSPQAEIVSPR